MSSYYSCADTVLAELKDFQKRTVKYVYERLYKDQSGSKRFLVADEVGLGKTLVARGIVAKALKHGADQNRFDVIYICSNSAIAAQNIQRLRIAEVGTPQTTRLTYLPLQTGALASNRVNFISLTPGTTFEHTRSRGGEARERAILFRILRSLSDFKYRDGLRFGLFNLLQATVGRDNWWQVVGSVCAATEFDANLAEQFLKIITKNRGLYSKLLAVSCRFQRYRDLDEISPSDSDERYELIGQLRTELAKVCVQALNPNLVILDEFQRFKYLLTEKNGGAAQLAKQLFESSPRVRVLLLSATPYRMLVLNHERQQEDHYPDFVQTLEFLYQDTAKVTKVKELLSEYRKLLQNKTTDESAAATTKKAIEEMLLQVMCRTERAATLTAVDSLLAEKKIYADITASDLKQAAATDRLRRQIDAYELIKYWKSVPYMWSFLKHYQFRLMLDKHFDRPEARLGRELDAILKSAASLPKSRIQRYQRLDPANPKMRILFQQTLDSEMWRLLWMPPSMPYSQPAGVFHGQDERTKTLIFSAWHAVPDAISAMVSYEAERRMIGGASYQYNELTDKVAQLLIFSIDPIEHQPKNMSTLLWLLPFPTLANRIDPLQIVKDAGQQPLSQEELRAKIKAVCTDLLEKLADYASKTGHMTAQPDQHPESQRADRRWYWAAPTLLEQQNADGSFLNWCHSLQASGSGHVEGKHEKRENFLIHLEAMLDLSKGHAAPLGRMPGDLADVLCDLALGAPGVCALRALSRLNGSSDLNEPELFSGALRMANGFRSLFNMPETIRMLRRNQKGIYWQLALQYCIDGNIQSMLDEYVHVLKESMGLRGQPFKEQVEKISGRIQDVLSIHTALQNVDTMKKVGRNFVVETVRIRCRFALRLADLSSGGTEQELIRTETVHNAFNSPFRPFILATTSVGQEGLDFHTWCHAVMHWDLPSNPVDLEQREGRVNRYKGHVVRKNIARHLGLPALNHHDKTGHADPWDALFTIAEHNKENGSSDLEPYWLYAPNANATKIDRIVPILPYSAEEGSYKQLIKNLVYYRLAFGQPRQEDLLNTLGLSDVEGFDVHEWVINLRP